MIPTWTSDGGSTTRPSGVGEHRDRGADQGAQRQHHGVVAADQRPDGVRRHQPDEGDRSGQGGAGRRPAARRPRRSRRRSSRRTPPEAAGDVVAEGERVEHPRAGQGEDRADERGTAARSAAPRSRGRRRCRPARAGRSPSSAGRPAAPPDVQLLTAAVTAAPAMASLTGVAPSRPSEATTWTRTAATAAPRNANQTYAESGETPEDGDRQHHRQAAPALMPRMPGSASGLRVRPCRHAPASPRAAPDEPARARCARAGPRATAYGGSLVSNSAPGETSVAPTRTDERAAPDSQCDQHGHDGRVPPGAARRAGWVRAVERVTRRRSPRPRGDEVLDDVRDRERGRVGHREADVLVLLGVRVAGRRWPGSGRPGRGSRTSACRRGSPTR